MCYIPLISSLFMSDGRTYFSAAAVSKRTDGQTDGPDSQSLSNGMEEQQQQQQQQH